MVKPSLYARVPLLGITLVSLVIFGAGCGNKQAKTSNVHGVVITNTTLKNANISTPNVTPTPTNTKSVTNANVSASNLTAQQVLGDPKHYADKDVCITGHYQQTFETSILGGSVKPNGQELNEPFIWIYKPDTTAKLQCYDSGRATSCYGLMTVCGQFRYKPAGGLSNQGNYIYALNGEATSR